MKPNKKMLMLMTCLMVGCQSVPQETPFSPIPAGLPGAKKLLAAGEIYQAKRQTALFLKENPSSLEGQQLMAEILNEEISQHKEVFASSLEDEMSDDGKKAEIKTLIERSRSLLALGAYDEAADAAETIFTYDAQNREASRLLDQIKEQAWASGKKEIMDGREIIKTEVDDRALIYRQQAQGYMSEGQWGAANMSVQKLLLLYPEDKEGLRMMDQIKDKQRRGAVPAAQS